MSDDFNPAVKFRALHGAAKVIERSMLFALTLISAAWAGELHVFANLVFFKEQFLGLFFALGLAGVFLRVKSRPGESGNSVPWHDWLCCGASLAAGLYITAM